MNPISPYPHGNDTEVRNLKNDPYDREESAVYGKLGPNGREEVDAFVQGTIPVSGGLTDAQLRATPVPVSGTVTTTGLTDTQLRATPVPVSGTVATGGLTDTQLRATAVPISGTITANLGTIDGAATEVTVALIKAKTDNLDVALSTRTKPSDQQHTIVDSGTVTISGTVPVSGPLTDTQLRATPVPVSGTVTTGGLTDTQLRATPVPVSGTVTATGPLTDTQLRNSAVPVSGAFFQVTQPVSGTFFQATQPVSGPLTDTQLRATPVPVSGTVTATGTVAVTQSTSPWVTNDPGLPDTLGQKTMAGSTGVVIASDQTAVPVSGTVAVSGTVGVTQSTSPWVTNDPGLPDTLGQKTMANSTGVVIASDQTAVPVSGTVTATGPLTDTQLRATPVPVSGTVTTGGLTDTQLRATPVPVSGTGVATQGTSPWVVSGTANPTTPSALFGFVTAVPTAGSRVQLANHAVVAGILQAPSTNSGLIYVGDVTVSSSVYGAELQPGQASGIAIDNTNRIYIDASVSGDKCAFLGS